MIKSRTFEPKDVPQNQQLALRGLALRLGQCGFVAAAIGVMVTSLGFSSFTTYWYFLIFYLFFVLFFFFSLPLCWMINFIYQKGKKERWVFFYI